MTFYRFKDEDIIHTSILAHPYYTVQLRNSAVTGSIFLEKPFLDSALRTRLFRKRPADFLGDNVQKVAPFTASVDIVTADGEVNGTNRQLHRSILELYDYYSFENDDYTADVTGSTTTCFRVITLPEIYYDREVLTGSFSASDSDSTGAARALYDNGRGGIYSGSLTGTLVGNIFYSEGLVVLKAGGLNGQAGNEFGGSSPTADKWSTSFKGTHTIPVKIFRCRAPAGQLNASTNPTFYHVPLSGSNKNEREIVLPTPTTYVTSVGLYNEHFELVGHAKLAQPIRKTEEEDILFRLRMDF